VDPRMVVQIFVNLTAPRTAAGSSTVEHEGPARMVGYKPVVAALISNGTRRFEQLVKLVAKGVGTR
jgi:hypothetical protein